MKPGKARRTILYLVGFVVLACAAVWIGSHYIAPRLALRVAIGGDQGESLKIMQKVATLMGSERWRMRFRYINFDDPAEAAKAMDAGRLDLLISRGDLSPRTRGQTLVIIRHDAIALIAPPDSPIEKFADIAKKTIAIPESPLQKQNEALLDLLLKFYAIDPLSVSRIFMKSADIGAAMRQKRVVAAFVVGPLGFGPISETVTSIRKTMRKPPSLIEMEEASAIIKKYTRLETVEVPTGAVNGNPPIPDEAVNTVGVTVRLLAASSMPASLAGDIARIVTTRKSALAEATPAAAQIEAPDTEDKAADLQVHPGASSYFSGDQPTLFDRFENVIYYGGFLASIIGSFVAWIVGRRRKGSRHDLDEASQKIHVMLQSVREIPTADEEQRKLIGHDLEMHMDWALGEWAAGRMENERYEIIAAIHARGRGLLERV